MCITLIKKLKNKIQINLKKQLNFFFIDYKNSLKRKYIYIQSINC